MNTTDSDIDFEVFDIALLNLKASRTALQKDELIYNHNYSYSFSGGINKEPGYFRLPAADAPDAFGVYEVYDFEQTNGSRFFLRVKGDKLQKYASSVWTNVGTLPATPSYVTMCTIADLCTIWSLDFVPQKFDGATLANLGGSPPTCSVAVTYAGRIFALGKSGSELSIFCCGQNAPETWAVPMTPAATDPAIIRVNPRGRSQRLTGFMPFFDRLVVGLDDSLAEMIGGGTGTSGSVGAMGINPYAADFKINPLNDDIGLIAHKGGVKAGNEWYFPSKKGFHMLSSVAAASQFAVIKEGYISAEIEDQFKTINKSQLGKIVGVHSRGTNEVIWLVPDGSSSTNNKALAYDYYQTARKKANVWSVWDDYPFMSAAEVEGEDGSSGVYFGSYDGLVKQLGGGSHDSASFTSIARYCTDLEVPKLQKTFRHMVLFFEEQANQTVTIIPKYDFKRTGRPITINLTGQGSFVMPVVLPAILGKEDAVARLIHLNGYGRFITLEIQASGTQPVRILGFIIHAEPRRIITA